MKFYYRGNPYQTETALLEVRESDIKGKYRGSKWTYKLPKHIPQIQPKLYLQYRGVAYSTCSNINVKPYFQESSAIVTDSSTANETQVIQKNLREVHLDNLRRNLERRMKIAQEKQNYHLLAMLEKECQQLSQCSLN
jgi:hypothetical protein